MSRHRSASFTLALGVLSALFAAFLMGAAPAQAQALNDPAKSGMKVLKKVEGCNLPGGLQPITSSEGPNDAMFWCGPPPYCLTMAPGSPERCHIIPGSRNGGTTGVRNPEDLRCDLANINPTGPTHAMPGRCPVPPTLMTTVNGVQAATLSQGANVTLRIDTSDSTPLSAPTALTMTCSGTNAAVNPFNQANLIAYAGQDRTFPAVAASNAGNTACAVTATNAAGSETENVSFNATPMVVTPAPTVTAQFTNSPVAVGSTKVTLRTRTTNATGNITWKCTGIWKFTDTRPASNGGWYTTSHNQGSGSSAGKSSTCTFTATGPGGTATTSASWSAKAASGSGGSGGGSIPVAAGCSTAAFRVEAASGDYPNYCIFTFPAANNGVTVNNSSVAGRYVCIRNGTRTARAQCTNGKFAVRSYTCKCGDTQ